MERSITLAIEAVEATPLDEANAQSRRERQYDLAVSLHGRYIRDGDISDLTRAADELDKVIQNARGTESDLDPDVVHELANIHYDMYEHRGTLADLEKAVDLYQNALTSAVETNSEFQERRICAALARALHALYAATGDGEHLELCITHMRKALELTSEDSVLFAYYQSYLGAFLGRL